MDQYVGDNERLRKKVSEVGERMEFYKEKLIKYRTLYFEAVGQDQQSRSSGNSSSQANERPSSGGARENISGKQIFLMVTDFINFLCYIFLL